jgi:NADH:ubiquinone oxidoreductase subunit 2 (subunit N)
MYIKGGARFHSVILPSMLKSASISALAILVLAATLLTVQATPWQPTIRGCAEQITSDGDVFKLVGTDTFSQFIQCECVHLNSLRFHFELSFVQPTKAICMTTAMVAHPGHTVFMCASHAVSLVIFLELVSLAGLSQLHTVSLSEHPDPSR